MFKKLSAIVAIASAVAMAVPAQAITNGVPDEGAHPYVGQAVLLRAR